MEDKVKKNEKQLVVIIDEDLHKEVKVRCAFKNVPIKAWVAQAIIEKMKQEDLYK